MKRYRLYFNRIEDDPQIWSVDEGSSQSEINVQDIEVLVPIETDSDLKAEYPEPKAWMQCWGNLEVTKGTAIIRG